MKTVRLFGFENLPEGYLSGTALSIHGLAYSDFQPQLITTTANGQNATPKIVGDKIVIGKAAAVPSGIEGAVIWPMTTLIGSTTPIKVIIGMRIERPITSGLVNILDWRTTANPATAILTSLLTAAQTPVGSVGYYEFVLDTVARTVTVFKDDVQLSSVAMVAGMTQANLSSLYLSVGRTGTIWISSGAGNVNDILTIADVYSITDDGVGGSSNIDRLGPLVVKRLPIASTTGAGYTPSNADTVTGVLNTDRAGNTTGVNPKVAVPLDNTPLKAKVSLTGWDGYKVRGIDIKVGAYKDASGDQNLTGAVKSNGVTSTAVNVPMSVGGLLGNVSVMTGTTLPDGSELTFANVNNLEVIITPST